MKIEENNVEATFKSQDTEEWLDVHFTRPIGYLWVRLFNHFNIHPNVVTLFSIFLGIGAGIMFCYSDMVHNIIGVLLLIWANIFDSCDGQLARLTGKTTRWGRMLDGFAGDVWFICLYLAVCCRSFHQTIPFINIEWSFWIFLLCFIAGVYFHARQCQLADYYRNIHLFFLPGVKSELDNSKQQQDMLNATQRKNNFWWHSFLWGYVRYTRMQESMTPHFQILMKYVREELHGQVSEQFRQDFRKQSLPLVRYANYLTFNGRAIVLYISFLVNLPWLYPLVEVTLFSVIALYMRYRHETMCQKFYEKLKSNSYQH